jgi:hypothetical protein
MSRPCCPDCSPYCQDTSLAVGQARATASEGWWAEPFDGEANIDAVVFWGDECCPQCATCPVCQGW